MTLLRDIAHARSGDKGNHSNISFWVQSDQDYASLRRTLTPAHLKACFPNLLQGPITIFELPHLKGLNVVLEDALEGGVNSSLNLDGHGKSWSCLFLGLPVISE